MGCSFPCISTNRYQSSKTPSPVIPLLKDDHLLKKLANDSYHWYAWKAPQSIGKLFVNCISLTLESHAKAICRLLPLVQIDSNGSVHHLNCDNIEIIIEIIIIFIEETFTFLESLVVWLRELKSEMAWYCVLCIPQFLLTCGNLKLPFLWVLCLWSMSCLIKSTSWLIRPLMHLYTCTHLL